MGSVRGIAPGAWVRSAGLPLGLGSVRGIALAWVRLADLPPGIGFGPQTCPGAWVRSAGLPDNGFGPRIAPDWVRFVRRLAGIAQALRNRRMETYPWPSDWRTDWQSVPVNLDLRVAQAAQAARSPQGATPAVGKGSVKWRAGFADSRDLLRAWQ